MLRALRSIPQSCAFPAIDEIDRAIIDQLLANGRISNLELADQVGVSASPCLRRLRRLEEAGVIRGYTTVVDGASIGRSYEPLVWVTLTEVTWESLSEFEIAVQEIADVIEAVRMMEQPDYLLRIQTSDADAFENLYMDQLAALPHVQTLTSQRAMKVVKRSPAPTSQRRQRPTSK